MIRASGFLLASLLAAAGYIVLTAPVDATQGVIQKILYVHVPCAFSAYLGFLVTGVGGALYLWKNDERFDRVALAGAQVGVVFCTLTLASGPIWAKGTWGHWWASHPRPSVTLPPWFIYLAYLLLRSFTEGSERTARFAGVVYGLVGMLAIPLNYYAIDLFGGAAMHPENLERGSLGSGMRLPFALSALTGVAAFLHLLLLRLDLEARRVRAARLAADVGN
jgi:heme exporter protein C